MSTLRDDANIQWTKGFAASSRTDLIMKGTHVNWYRCYILNTKAYEALKATQKWASDVCAAYVTIGEVCISRDCLWAVPEISTVLYCEC